MGIPTRGSRAIELDGVSYRWRIRKLPTCRQALEGGPMTVAVQRATDGRSVLVVDLGVTRPDNWMMAHSTGITPAQVRDFVRQAFAAGWDPQRGCTFHLRIPVIQDTVGVILRGSTATAAPPARARRGRASSGR